MAVTRKQGLVGLIAALGAGAALVAASIQCDDTACVIGTDLAGWRVGVIVSTDGIHLDVGPLEE